MRILRVHGDENVPPTSQAYKTLHSRNKSSPSLSTMVTIGAAKLAVKRAAFGDVSNTAHGNRPTRDDSIINSKTGFELNEKVTQFQQEKKPTAFLRPAQRPLSVSGLKALLNNVANVSAETNNKQGVAPPANIRKVLTKRNNTISTVPSTTIAKDVADQHLEKAVVEIHKLSSVTAPTAPVHRELNSRSNQYHAEEVQLTFQRPQNTNVIPVIEERKQDVSTASTVPTSSGDAVNLHPDGAYVDDFGNVNVCEYTDETDEPHGYSVEPTTDGPQQAEAKQAENATRLHQLAETRIETAGHEMVQKHSLPPVSEPEEYWDEDDDENYEEDGYVTARSFKSRGDNTTGGATTILFPKVTNKVRREISAAKELVESTRTADEIEDEAWDMSMVAEYGDEIFSYMKELEVCIPPAPVNILRLTRP